MRLNQLQLPDETRLGLVLIWGWLVLDAALNPALGGFVRLGLAFGISEPRGWMVGLLQVASLLGLTATLAIIKLGRMRAGLGLSKVAEADPKLAAETDYLGRHLTRGRARFFVTGNAFDTNAFCFAAGSTPWIVLGGGLRLLLRKERRQAQAVISHECAHVQAGDTLYLLVTWYTFVAYVCLSAFNLVLLQGQFWILFPAAIESYYLSGLGLAEFARWNASAIFLNGFPTLVAIAGIAVALMHFIRQREFRADETTGIGGWREPLISVLERAHRSGLRFLARFHPAAQERASRLRDERSWARLDWPFVAGMALVGSRLESVLQFGDDAELAQADGMSIEEWTVAVADAISWDGALSFLLALLIGFVVVLHVHRVAATQYHLGEPLLRRFAVCSEATAAIFAGVFLSTITSLSVVSVTASPNTPLTFAHALDHSLSSATNAAFLALGLAIAVVIVSGPAMRKPVRSPLLQASILFGGTMLVTLLLQIAFSTTVMAFRLAGLQLPRITVDWLPVMSRSRAAGELPSLLQVLIAIVVFLALLKLTAFFAREPCKALPGRVDASRLIQGTPRGGGAP